MGNLFAELKRRHIYRVAAAYAVVAWVLLQLFNNLTPILKLPDWAGTLVLVFLIGGFPIALFFAWMRELAPADGASAQAATGKLDWALIGALVVVIGLVSYQQLVSSPGAGTREANAASPSPNPGGIAIAVLPFINLSGDAAQEFFSDGMTEEITASLAKVPDLHVVGRSSAFQFKGQSRDLRAVGQALGASHLIEGSVRKAGERVRITAELVRADNGLQLWSENYDRELTDIFAIQEDIAQAIAASLRVPLGLAQGETLVRTRAKDDASYEDYLRARALIRARGYNRLADAAKLLDQVVERDPNFAPAWAQLALANAYAPFFHPASVSGAYDQLRPIADSSLAKAEVAARRALELDPKNPEAYSVLGIVQTARENYSGMELLARALALDADNPEILYINGLVLADLGYIKQSLTLFQRLRKLEPFVPVYNGAVAQVMSIAGQSDAAIEILKPLVAGGTGLGAPALNLARTYAALGRYNEAADALQTIPDGIYLPGTVETAASLLRTAPAKASSETLPRLGGLGFVYLYVGAADHVLDNREASHKIGLWSQVYAYWGQSYATVRKTERFKSLMRDAGYLAYWRAKGWPDLCRPMGADDFVCD